MTADSSPPNHPQPQPAPRAPQGRRRMLLLALLLVVAAAAAAWFYLPDTPEPAPPIAAPAQPQTQVLPVPQRPLEAPAQPAEQAPRPLAKHEAARGTAVPAPVASLPHAEDKERPQAASAPAVADALPSAVSAEPHQPAPEVVAQQPSPAVADERYLVHVGAFTDAAHLQRARRIVSDLGFEPKSGQVVREVVMTRLRVGTFFPSQGDAVILELRQLGADPFVLMDGDLMVVYAGSFRDTARARRLAEQLRLAGHVVALEPSLSNITLTTVRFGAFDSLEQARAAAEKARARGLEAMVLKAP